MLADDTADKLVQIVFKVVGQLKLVCVLPQRLRNGSVYNDVCAGNGA